MGNAGCTAREHPPCFSPRMKPILNGSTAFPTPVLMSKTVSTTTSCMANRKQSTRHRWGQRWQPTTTSRLSEARHRRCDSVSVTEHQKTWSCSVRCLQIPSRNAYKRPTIFMLQSSRQTSQRTSFVCSARHLQACYGASNFTTTTSKHGWQVTLDSHHHRQNDSLDATTSGRISSTRMLSQCPINGNIPGTPLGTWLSTASHSLTSTPTLPRNS